MAITFGQMERFLTVVRLGSVTEAADELWVTQPSVSAAIASLGREIGAPVFEREGRHLSLTAAGMAFHPYVEQILGLIEEGVRAAREADGAQARRVRIAAVTTAGEHLAPALLQGFADTHPEIEIELHVGNREQVLRMLRGHDVDIAVSGRPPVGEPVTTVHRIMANTATLITAAHDPITYSSYVGPSELVSRTWLLREPGSGTRAMSLELFKRIDIVPPTVTMGSNGAIREAVALGLGIALLPSIAVAAAIDDGRLAAIPFEYENNELRHWHLIAPDGPIRPAVEQFIEHVINIVPDVEWEQLTL